MSFSILSRIVILLTFSFQTTKKRKKFGHDLYKRPENGHVNVHKTKDHQY
jgi:hypothetical protein